jgi:predicted Zn-dependent peptidase
MPRRIQITLSNEDFERLQGQALLERRRVVDQAALFVERALRRRTQPAEPETCEVTNASAG